MHLSDREFRIACKRRRQSVSWERIVLELGLKCAAEDVERAVKVMRSATRRTVEMLPAPSAARSPSIVAEVSADDVEDDVAPSIVARICGDPSPRKSALATRGLCLKDIEHDPLDDLKHPLVFRSRV